MDCNLLWLDLCGALIDGGEGVGAEETGKPVRRLFVDDIQPR